MFLFDECSEHYRPVSYEIYTGEMRVAAASLKRVPTLRSLGFGNMFRLPVFHRLQMLFYPYSKVLLVGTVSDLDPRDKRLSFPPIIFSHVPVLDLSMDSRLSTILFSSLSLSGSQV